MEKIGWECPKCESVYAPSVAECVNCSKVKAPMTCEEVLEKTFAEASKLYGGSRNILKGETK